MDFGERVETWQVVDSSSIAGAEMAPPPVGGIGGSDAAADEAALEEEILEELEVEGWTPVPAATEPDLVERQQQNATRLVEVDRAVLVGRGALGA